MIYIGYELVFRVCFKLKVSVWYSVKYFIENFCNYWLNFEILVSKISFFLFNVFLIDVCIWKCLRYYRVLVSIGWDSICILFIIGCIDGIYGVLFYVCFSLY